MRILVLGWYLLMCLAAWGQESREEGLSEPPFLFRGLSAGHDKVVFALAGSLWRLDEGSETAIRLTEGRGGDRLPKLSPDGKSVAFFRSNDVYLLNLSNLQERRLTFHPGVDVPVSWSVDGTSLVFSSARGGMGMRLFRLGLNEVFPQALPLEFGVAFAPAEDGRAAYVPMSMQPDFRTGFRAYRGGLAGNLFLLNKEGNQEVSITKGRGSVFSPHWEGDTLFFVWDQSGHYNIYRWRQGTRPTALTQFEDRGIRHASFSGERSLFTRNGRLYQMNLRDGSVNERSLRLKLDYRERGLRLVNALNWTQSVQLNHGGDTVLIGARGDLFSYNFASRQSQNLTKTDRFFEREGAVSTDGRLLAYFSDQSGENQLVIREFTDEGIGDMEDSRVYDIEDKPAFYADLMWSPNGRFVSFSDNRLRLWLFDVVKEQFRIIDQSDDPGQDRFRAVWSPNGRFLAYEKRLANRLPTIFVFDSSDATVHPVSDGRTYACFPSFDASGRLLYFFSSPNAGGSDYKWGVLGGNWHENRDQFHLQAAVLQNNGSAPVLAGGVPNQRMNWDHLGESAAIDFEGLPERIVHAGDSPRYPLLMAAGRSGEVIMLIGRWPEVPHYGTTPRTDLVRYRLRAPGPGETIARNVTDFRVSGDRQTLYYQSGSRWFSADLNAVKVVGRAMSPRVLMKSLDPRSEWTQIFFDTVRHIREFMYDPGLHGTNLDDLTRYFASFLPNLSSREELSHLLARLIGDMSVSHSGISGGDMGPGRQTFPERIGLLGADFHLVEGHYRFEKVYRLPNSDATSDGLIAPLDFPGMDVFEGDKLISVNNTPVSGERNVYSYFLGTVGQTVRLGIANRAGERRTVLVTPIANEREIRIADWAENNRRWIDEQSNGRIGYVHVPGWSPTGLRHFLRGFYGQNERDALIIDQRFNGGGTTPDAVIEMLSREPVYGYLFREGNDRAVPVNHHQGANVLMINQWNGSAAETFALMFKLSGLGPIVGMPTIGAGIGPYARRPRLIDSGFVRIPNRAAFDPTGRWGIENEGVSPDHPVERDLGAWLANRDLQLERALRIAEEAAARKRPSNWKHPTFPNQP